MNTSRTIKVVVDARQAEIGAKKYQAAVGGMATAGKRASRGVSGLDVAMKSAKKSMASALATITLVSSALVALGGISLGFSGAISSISSFEETMETARSVSRATAEEFGQLRDRAKELGASTRFSATQAGQGFVNLSRAGFKVNESLSSINGTLDLAAVATLSLGSSADIVTSSIRQFGLEASATEMVVDTLFATSNRANTSVAELASGLEVVGPIANSINQSIGKTAAVIGVLSDSGIKGSKAGTGLRAAISQLLKPTDQAVEVLSRLNLTASEVSPQFNSIDDIFEKLGKSGITTADAFKIFGSEASTTALILSKNYQRIRDLNEETSNATGEARAAAEAMSKTLGGALRSLGSATEALILNLGDAGLTFVLKNFVVTLTGALQILAGMEGAVTQNVDAAQSLAEAFRIAGAAALGFGVAQLVTGFFALSSAIGAATAGTNLLTVAMSINPVGAVATALGLAAAAAYRYRDAVVEVGDTTATVGDFAVGIWEAITKRISFVASRFVILFQGIKLAFDQSTKVVGDFLDGLGVDWSATLSRMGTNLKKTANFIVGVFDGVARSISGVFDNISGIAKAAAEFDFSSPIQSAVKLNKAMDKAFSPTANFEIVKKQFEESLNKDFVGDALQIGKNIGSSLIQGINSSPELKQGLADLQELFGPSGFAADVNRSAAARSSARQSAQGAARVKAAIDETNRILGNLPDRVGEVITGADASNLAGADSSGIVASDSLGAANQSAQNAANSLQSFSSGLDETTKSVTGNTAAFTSAKSAVSSLAASLASAAFQANIDKASNFVFEKTGLSKLFGSANGNVFTGGNRLVPFANGGVFDQPATFNMADGRTGLAFEAGPEAIMPLARDSRGRLGVRQQGGEGERQAVTNNYRINVQTPNPDAFRKSQRQIRRSVRRAGG